MPSTLRPGPEYIMQQYVALLLALLLSPTTAEQGRTGVSSLLSTTSASEVEDGAHQHPHWRTSTTQQARTVSPHRRLEETAGAAGAASPPPALPANSSFIDWTAWLTQHRHSQQWVSIVTSPHSPSQDGSYSGEQHGTHRRLLLNTIHSLVTYGEQPEYVFLTNSAQDVRVCEESHLRCVDLARVPKMSGSERGMTRSIANLYGVLEVLRHGVNVHVVELGTVVFKPVEHSLRYLFNHYPADGIFDIDESGWSEEVVLNDHISLVSTGTFALHANVRTVTALESLMHMLGGGGWSGWDDVGATPQAFLSVLHLVSWDLCWSPATCLATQRKALAAFLRAPHMYNGTNEVIMQDSATYLQSFNTSEEACSGRRLHARCLATQCHNLSLVAQAITSLQLWLVDADGAALHAGGGSGGAHPFLPCRDRLAWAGHWMNPTNSWA